MAGRTRSAAAKHAYRLFAPVPDLAGCPACPSTAEDFDESDIWGSFNPAALEPNPVESTRIRPIPTARAGRKKPVDRSAAAAAAHGSLPMNIPDWSKILGGEYREHHAGEWELEDDEDGDVAGGTVVPPHELMWRSRAASLSVHEGIGRTLKGRDLSRVRDAVWKKTGFED